MNTTYTATWQGKTYTRTSKRTYTHASVVRWWDGREAVISFHGSEQAARKGVLTGDQKRSGAAVIAAIPVSTPATEHGGAPVDVENTEQGTEVIDPAGRVYYVSEVDYDGSNTDSTDGDAYLWLLPEGGKRRRRLYQRDAAGWTVKTAAVEPTAEVEPAPAAVEGAATTAYRYGGFKDSDARELSGRVATITTHSDPEIDPDGVEPGETFGPHYVCHVAGKSNLMLLPATYKAGDAIAPERVVALIEVASVTLHECEAAAEVENTERRTEVTRRKYIDAVAAALARPGNVDMFESLMPYLTNVCPDCDREITTDAPWYAKDGDVDGHRIFDEFIIITCKGTRLIPSNKIGLSNPRRCAEDAYALAVHEALNDPARAEAMRPWITDTCPECGEIAGEDDGMHVRSDGVLAIGCEGYYVINPNVIGIDSPNWQDWRTPVEPVEVEQDAATAPARRRVVDGWDGNSRPMVALVDPCGCKWTADGSARLSVCTPCLTRACAEQAAAAVERAESAN